MRKYYKIFIFFCILFWAVSCSSLPEVKTVPSPTNTTTPITPSIVPTMAISGTKRTPPAGTPISKEYVPFDIDGFEHLPKATAGQLFIISNQDLDKISQKLYDIIPLDGSHSKTPMISNSYSVEFWDNGTKATLLAGYQYEWDAMSKIGFILLDSNGNIVYYSSPEEYAGYVHFRLVPVQLSSKVQGIFLTVFTETGGSGIYPVIYRKLFIWNNGNPNLVWSWNNQGGSQVGIGNQMWANLYVNFESLSHNHTTDITLEKQGRIVSEDLNYWVYFPGKLVFTWVDNHYILNYFYDGKELHPIHSNALVLAAGNGIPANVGSLWDKIVDRNSEQWNNWYLYDRLRYDVGYDNKNIYFTFTIANNNVLQVGLDADLESDFNSSSINSDDFIFDLDIPEVPHDSGCKGIVKVKPISPAAQKVKVTISSAGDFLECNISLTIPRSDLSLDGNLITSPGTTYNYRDSLNMPIEEYHLGSGKLIGIAVQPKQFSHIYKFDMTNPTTWGTLIFASNK